MTEPIDLLILNAAQVVTCAGDSPKRGAAMRDVGVIPDGAVAVSDGVIVAIGETDDLRGRFTAREVINASGRVVCPGFIDCHTHAVYAGDRLDEFEQRIAGASYLDILARGGGILSTMRAVRAATVESLAAESVRRVRTMLAHGTTTAEVKTGYGLSLDAELAMLRALEWVQAASPVELVPTFLGAHAVPPEYAGDADGYVSHVVAHMLPAAKAWFDGSAFAESDAPFSVDVFCERNAFDLDQSRRVLQAAREMGLAVRAHVDEFTDLGGVGMAVELGALSVDHLDVTGADANARLAASDTVGVVLPAVNFNLGSAHYADARAMIDAGVALALATDLNPGSAPCYSLPMVMVIACRHQKLLPAEALNAVTINAAHALGIGHRAGSIAAGKQADLLIADVPDYRALAYDFGVNHVVTVVKRGRVASFQ